MPEYGFSLKRILLYKDRIVDDIKTNPYAGIFYTVHIGKNTGKITLKYWENISPLLPGSNKRKYIFKQICMAFCYHQDLKV